MIFKEKIFKLNTVPQATGLIFTFINTSFQLKFMNQDMMTEILVMKLKDQKSWKKNLIVRLIKLILMKSNHSIKSKCLKWIVKKIMQKILGMKNTQSKIRSKNEFREKSNYVVCRSSKSIFLKQKIKQDNKVLKNQLF